MLKIPWTLNTIFFEGNICTTDAAIGLDTITAHRGLALYVTDLAGASIGA